GDNCPLSRVSKIRHVNKARNFWIELRIGYECELWINVFEVSPKIHIHMNRLRHGVNLRIGIGPRAREQNSLEVCTEQLEATYVALSAVCDQQSVLINREVIRTAHSHEKDNQ